MTRVGILSDTHIDSLSPWFTQQVQQAFQDCSTIFHAGDLTNISILDVFRDKEIHAVHGNMCDMTTRQILPTDTLIKIDGYTIGLCHGAGARHNIEERMWNMFPTADCIVYGHTHIPVCHKFAKTLFINPGSFTGTGKYGAPGTYAILSISSSGLTGTIQQLEEQQR